MGQKIHPIGFRLIANKNWDSKWFRKHRYFEWLLNDYQIRLYILNIHKLAGIAKIIIERAGNKCKIGIHASKPGLIIGKKGIGIEQLKKHIKSTINNKIYINIYEIKKPEINAQLIANSITQQIEKRVSFKRCMKKSIFSAQKIGIRGIKILLSGRLGGSEMSRKERFLEGRVPLHTIKAFIDYGQSTSYTMYGTIGCKVWLFKGDIHIF